ncbi:hypothetical protein L2750_12805 [Shewanella submarina]|uniref:Chemotaxis protein n=1 Tax=Shewanella submarina TaxID=2016376 RepID=A0ABV7GHB4_9GAMM|nr:hypothetical protein [Shewanella submarina]MCL1038029.1 hypothetical protein [Shewanella submarina]
MGSSSRSNSSQQTRNSSVSFGVQGPNNGIILNGNGNTVTDGGAFKLVGDIVGQLPMLFASGMNAVTDVSQMGERQTEQAFNTATDLYGEASNSLQEMARLGADVMTDAGDYMHSATQEAFDFGRSAIDTAGHAADSAIDANVIVSREAMDNSYDMAAMVATSLENANANNTDLAHRSMDNAAYMVDGVTSFADSLTDKVLDSAETANKDATGQLIRGFESMMGFAEDYSRSDGTALAESNNKTLLYMMGGLAVTALGAAFIMRGQ